MGYNLDTIHANEAKQRKAGTQVDEDMIAISDRRILERGIVHNDRSFKICAQIPLSAISVDCLRRMEMFPINSIPGIMPPLTSAPRSTLSAAARQPGRQRAKNGQPLCVGVIDLV